MREAAWQRRLQSDQYWWNASGRVTRTWRLNRRRVSAAVGGIRSRPVSSVMNAGGAYVLGGAKTFPQLSGPLFSWLAAGVPAGGSRFRWRGGACGAGGDGKERVREHGQGDVPVPGAVAADLVVVQPGLVLGLGEAVLNSPPGSRYRRELGERDRAGRPAAVKGQLKLAPFSPGCRDRRTSSQCRPLSAATMAQS